MVSTDDLQPSEDLLRCLRSVDDTLERYSARILVQNFPAEVVEGEWSGFFTLLQFDDRDHAQRWYRSPEDQAIQGSTQVVQMPQQSSLKVSPPGIGRLI